ncbi:hypothetical protein ACFFKU_06985 [Kineococcus gynurae]|uniref:Uncharacterized protein n=1 Tax=Kineococcus gynurae TaxID=452979 RepID=A0ABV5LWV3_9ACTN
MDASITPERTLARVCHGCGHTLAAHLHYRAQRDCAATLLTGGYCSCPEFRAPRPVRTAAGRVRAAFRARVHRFVVQMSGGPA